MADWVDNARATTTPAPAPAGGDWVDSARGAPPAPSAQRRKPKTQYTSINRAGPFAAFEPIIEGAREAPAVARRAFGRVQAPTASAFGKAMDLLARPGMAAEHLYASPSSDPRHMDWRGAGHIFLHSETPEQQGADRAAIRAQLGTTQSYARAPHWQQGIGDAVIDTLIDPTTFIGGGGVLEGAGRSLARRALPAAVSAGRSITEGTARAAARVGLEPEARDALARTGKLVTGLYEHLGPHNRVGVQGVALYGAPGREVAQTAVMARGASRANRQQLQNAFHEHFERAIEGLTPEEEREVYHALHIGAESQLPQKLQERAAQLSTLTDTLAHLQGTQGLRNQLAQHGFQLPEAFKPFDVGPRRIMRASSYRKNYIPIPHDPGALWMDEEERVLGGQLAKRQAARRSRLASAYDPHLAERGEEPAGKNLWDTDLLRESFRNRLRAGARSIAGRDARAQIATDLKTLGAGGAKGTQLANLANVKAKHLPGFIEEYMSPVFKDPTDRSAFAQLVSKAITGTVDIPKLALFAFPFRHMVNIATLGAVHDPGALAEAVPLFFKQFARGAIKPDAQRRALMHDAYDAGVLSVGAMDRAKPWTQKLPEFLGRKARSLTESYGAPSIIGKGVEGALSAPAHLYGTSSNVLWAFDDALKTATYRRALRRGLSPQEASRETLNALIDYGNVSDLTNAVRYVAPFATYRTKMPGAVLRATLKHPERPLIAGRAAPALVGGQQPSKYADPQGTPMVTRTYTPLSDVYGGIDDPYSFVRSTMSWPAQLTASAVNLNPPGREEHYYTYGYPRDEINRPAPWTPGAIAKYGANQFPYVQNVLQKQGLGIFPDRGFVRPLVEGQSGVRLTYPHREPGTKRDISTDRSALRVRSVEASFRRPISELKKAGDTEGAALLDRMMRAKVLGDEKTYATLSEQWQAHRLRMFSGGNSP